MNLLLVIILTIALASILGFKFVVQKVHRRQLFHNTVLAENVLISPEWQQIDTRNLIKVNKDRHFIGVVLELPLETPYGSGGIKIPSGKIINPEIKLFDDSENEYNLTRSGSGGTDTSRYEYEGQLPLNKTYTKVLLRSDYPIMTKQILWSGFNNRDLK